MRLALIFFCALLVLACETLEPLDRTLNEVTPTHPVTGRPLVNVVDEKAEVAQAQKFWSEFEATAVAQQVAVDQPNPHYHAIKRSFARLTDVSHRRELPWQAHLVNSPDANAFTVGGGVVVVFEGLFGNLIPDADDDALAAVLAHEIAHVTLLHIPKSQTWQALGPLISTKTDDDYYRASYTTAQEAEADKLSLLYLALAGYDIAAPMRVWAANHMRDGSSAARAGYLNDHPMSSERVQIAAAASKQVAEYWIPGRRNPDADEILENNVLFPRSADVGSGSGAGFLKAATAVLDAAQEHNEAEDEARARKKAASSLGDLQILRVVAGSAPNGAPALFVDVKNDSRATVTGLRVRLSYLRGANLLAQDTSCAAPVSIPPGGIGRLGCVNRMVQGSTEVQPEIIDIRY